MAVPTRLVTVLAVLFLVGGCTSDDGAADEPTTTVAASTTTEITTTTQAPPSTAATTTTDASLAGALEGLAAAKGAVSTTTTDVRPIVPMTLTFDGEGCIFDGPTELTPGPVKYTFVNQSNVPAVQNFVEVLEGKTHEDMITHNGPEPFATHHPSWSRELGTWWTTKAGASKSWRKYLEPGSYFMVCGQEQPLLAWNGPWLTVAE